MAESVVSDMTNPIHYQNPPNRYHSKMYEDFQASPTTTNFTATEHQSHARSSSAGTSTLAPSAPSERSDDKARHFSDGSQVGYAEMVAPQPQFIDISTQRNSDKEAYRSSDLSNSTAQDGTLAPIKDEDEDAPPSRKRRCGMIIPVFWVVLVGVVIIVLALALGLGLGLGLKKSSSPHLNPAEEAEASLTMIGGSINPQYYSKQGAFNGTGIAIASTSSGREADLFVFYQKYSGELQQLLRTADGTWHAVTTVATDARNATPITAVAYQDDAYVAYTHVFYLDHNSVVRQKTSSNASQSQENIWFDGPLSALNLQSIDSELTGLQACYWGNYYGSATNSAQDSQNQSRSQPTTGINLFYAADNTTFVQYDWTNGRNAWNQSNTFPNMNTHAGIGCQTWQSGTTQYVFMVDISDTVRIMWRDTALNITSTPQHPINIWTNTSVTIPNVHPSTSLGYTDFLAYQDAEALFHGVNITWAAENTTIATVLSGSGSTPQNNEWVIPSDRRGIPGSHMAITAIPTGSNGRELALFYQSVGPADNGRAITIQWRDSSSTGFFSSDTVPVNITAS